MNNLFALIIMLYNCGFSVNHLWEHVFEQGTVLCYRICKYSESIDITFWIPAFSDEYLICEIPGKYDVLKDVEYFEDKLIL